MLSVCVDFDVRSQEAASAVDRGSSADEGRRLQWEGDVDVAAVGQCPAVDVCRLRQTADTGPSVPTSVKTTVRDGVCIWSEISRSFDRTCILHCQRSLWHHIHPFTAELVKALHLPYWSNPLFLIVDIRALWRSGLSARAPKCQNLKIVG